MLTDIALLEIFDFFYADAWIEAWYTLVHVCRKWRNIVFWSPRRLNLRLYCTDRTPVRETIDAWPPLPIHVKCFGHDTRGKDNILAALEHSDRIRKLDLSNFPSSHMDQFLEAMHRPFSALAHLAFHYRGETVQIVPASFLGGSAPQLQTLDLYRIPFPGLPNLLLSATRLVQLQLHLIPHSGYFSPEAMVTALTVLASLENLHIKFGSPQSRPDQKTRRPPPPTRTLLLTLKHLWFVGVSEYLDDLVARIDAPLLDELEISFFHQLIYDTPQLTEFINRTPKFKAYNEARVEFSDSRVSVTTDSALVLDGLGLKILCTQSDWQLSSLAQVCSSGFIPTVEHLYIFQRPNTLLPWQDDIESSQWLEVLQPLTVVRELYICREFTPRIAPTLEEVVGRRVTEVLPALQTLFLEEAFPSGPVQGSIGKFVAARELAGRPIAVSRWKRF